MKFIIFFLCFAYAIFVFAQTPGEGRLFQKMDAGVDLMKQGEFEKAEKEFLYVMRNLDAVPSDLVFYFGQNSYHLEKYKQSINWLNKYIQLKGTQGRFYEEATKYLQLAEDQYLKRSQEQAENVKKDFTSGEYDCGGLSKMICPVCKGEGVIIKDGPFEKIYQTCPYSNGQPFLSCEEYNLFMRGELKPQKIK